MPDCMPTGAMDLGPLSRSRPTLRSLLRPRSRFTDKVSPMTQILPTQTLLERAPVVIIGGGVIGDSIARHLGRLGLRDVVVLERDKLTSGTSWHAARLIVSEGMSSDMLIRIEQHNR